MMEKAKAEGDQEAYDQARKTYDQAVTQKAMDTLATEQETTKKNAAAFVKQPAPLTPEELTQKLTDELIRDENKNLDFDIISHELDAIRKWEKPWTPEEAENLTTVQKIAAIVERDPFTEEDQAEAEQLIASLHPTVVPQSRRSGWSTADPDFDNWRARDKAIHDLARHLVLRRLADQLTCEPAEEVDNPRLLGLRTAQEEAFKRYNRAEYYGQTAPPKPYLGDVEPHLQESIARVQRGDQPAPAHILDGANERTILQPRDRVFNTLHPDSPIYYQQLYLATVFPTNELKDEMDRVGINGVSVTPFYNSREWGNVYTVMTPEGGTRSFSVYEHRNTDSIIINGQENWDGEGLAYAGDSKNAFYAEFHPDDRKRAAQALTFYMMEAQSGDLNSDKELVADASRRDWTAILSASIPGFAEWSQKRAEQEAAANKESDEDILSRLDF